MHLPDAADARRLAEEMANSLTHGLGLVLSLGGFVVLVALASMHGTALQIAACAVYGTTLVALYAASTLYHGCRHPHRKRLLRLVDHCAIFLLIAGTYTPLTLLWLPPRWGWTLFAVVWTLALAGIAYKIFFLGRYPRVGLMLYLLMGWLAIFAIQPILAHVPPSVVLLLFGGGLFYTAGVWFYVRDHKPYRHAVWHLFVLGGSACHYFAVLATVLPQTAI
jgi:hemolysin III